jgi:hypothetical protein
MFLLYWTAFGFTAMAQETPGPKLVLENHEFDFGKVMEGEHITHTFTFLNQGEEQLLIHQVRPD